MTALERQELDVLGYVILCAPKSISPELLTYLEGLFESAGENAGHDCRSDPFARNIEITGQDLAPFAALLADATVLECVQSRLGPAFELVSVSARSLNPFALAFDPPACRPRAASCRVLWLLDDFSSHQAAAIALVPGSHRCAPPSGISFDLSDTVPVSGRAGTAIVVDGRLFAAPVSNPAGRHLRTLSCEYVIR